MSNFDFSEQSEFGERSDDSENLLALFDLLADDVANVVSEVSLRALSEMHDDMVVLLETGDVEGAHEVSADITRFMARTLGVKTEMFHGAEADRMSRDEVIRLIAVTGTGVDPVIEAMESQFDDVDLEAWFSASGDDCSSSDDSED